MPKPAPAPSADAPETNAEDQGYIPTSRDAEFDAIAEHRDKELEAEGVDLSVFDTEGGHEARPNTTTEGDETPGDEPPPKTGDPPSGDLPVYFKDGVLMAKVKVQGKEKEVPYDEAVAAFQKASAAADRLRQASEKDAEADRRLKEADAIRAQAEELLRQASAKPPAQTRQPSAKDAGNTSGQPPSADAGSQGKAETSDSDLVDQYHQALLDGDEDEANRLFKSMRGRPGIDEKALAAEVSQQVLRTLDERRNRDRFDQDRREANEWFTAEERYATLREDPDSRARINAEAKQLVAREGKLVREALETAAENELTRAFRRVGMEPPPREGGNGKESSTPDVQVSEQRTERKRATRDVRPSNSGTPLMGDAEIPNYDPAKVIAEMQSYRESPRPQK